MSIFTGSAVAIITPFNNDEDRHNCNGNPDDDNCNLHRHIKFDIALS